MNVQDTVAALIKNWPTLYETRTDALMHLFSHYDTKWVNGELVASEDDLNKSPRDYSQEHHWDLSEVEEHRIHEILWKSEANALITWRIENATLLAQDTQADLSRVNCKDLWMHTNHFDDIPEDVTEDWFAAAKELAWVLHRRTKDVDPNSHGASTRKNVIRFMHLHGLLDNESRNRRIAELEKELEALRAVDEEAKK